MDSEFPDFEELPKRQRERKPAPKVRRSPTPRKEATSGESPFAGVEELKPQPLERTGVDWTLVPRRVTPPRKPPRPPHEPRGGAPLPVSSILLALGAACVALFAVLQLTNGGGHASSPSAVAPPNATPPPVGAPAPGTNPNVTPPPQPQAAVRWSHDVQLALNTPYSFGTYPLTRTQSFGHGLEVNKSSAGTQLVADGDGDTVSPWRGRGAPSAKQCASNAPASDRVDLGGSGVPIGGWICAQSGGDLLRLKYRSGQANLVSSNYQFSVTVWNR